MGDDNVVTSAFCFHARDVAAVGHALNRPNTASIMHSVRYAFKNILAVVANEGFTHKFDEAGDVLGYLADPSAFKAAAAPAAGEGAAEEAEAEPEEEEPDADGIVMNLGGDDDDAW